MVGVHVDARLRLEEPRLLRAVVGQEPPVDLHGLALVAVGGHGVGDVRAVQARRGGRYSLAAPLQVLAEPHARGVHDLH